MSTRPMSTRSSLSSSRWPLRFVVDAARGQLVRGPGRCGGFWLNPKTPHVAVHRVGPKLHPDLTPDGVHRVGQRLGQRDHEDVLRTSSAAARRRSLLLFSPRPRVGRYLPVSSGRRGHDLERRARRVARLGRAVEALGLPAPASALRRHSFGSYAGRWPSPGLAVCGSCATTRPLRPLSACSAALCPRGSSAVRRSSPSSRLPSIWSIRDPNSSFWPAARRCSSARALSCRPR